jgi:hypothetical protein
MSVNDFKSSPASIIILLGVFTMLKLSCFSSLESEGTPNPNTPNPNKILIKISANPHS